MNEEAEMPSQWDISDSKQGFNQLVRALYNRFNRTPMMEEVYGFIMGSAEEREFIWNFGLVGKDDKTVRLLVKFKDLETEE